MNILIIVYLFILGSVLGSFLGVVGDRLPKNESIVRPKRSYCSSCKHPLGFIDMIPIISYIFTLGKCRYCGKKVSVIYPIIEVLTGILFIVSYHVFGFNYQFFVAIILSSLLITVVISDIKYLIIPDEVVIISAILIIVTELIGIGFVPTLIQIGYGLLSFCLMYLLMLLGNFMFKKESLGGGDIKLMFIAGLCLDPFVVLLVIFFSSLIALPVSLVIYAINKDHVIPYGPFLVLSMLGVYFFQLNIDKVLTFIE